MAIETHLFYFSSAAQLREFAGFTVEPSHQARPGQDPATVTMYTVVAQRSGIGQRESSRSSRWNCTPRSSAIWPRQLPAPSDHSPARTWCPGIRDG
ncbi:hypothetical protein [Pseudomonas putida]|uniref:hypothetical protein n=1 Tax=Pseudomonas putida TaxID=303 RepID=UPI0026580CCC|nr:hypothetical protein [Pseudomonas putida]MCZ9640988.1 hypothetical protein [Pseudomonas putida]